MGKTQNLGHLAHIVAYDGTNHITVPAGITMHTNQLVASQSYVTTALGSYALSSALGSYVPTSRTITINGTTFDLSANRNWDITSMIYPAVGIALSTGSAWGTSITNNSGNWNTAFGWGNHASASYATTTYVGTAIANLVASAPATLDTLNELAAALGNDAAFSTTISTALGNRLRVDINTQGLSATLQGYGRTNLGLGTAATSATGDFAAASHTHTIANVTGLQTALDGKQASLGFTPYNATNPSGYITSSGNISGYSMSLNGFLNQTIYTILDGPANGPVIKVRYDSATANRYIDIGTKDGNGAYTEGFKIYNGGTPTWAGNAIWHAGNLTNLNQLANGPGYITSDSTKLPLAGGTLTGNLLFSDSGTTKRGIQGTVGTNDMWFVGGNATASNAGFLEISTGDDGQTAGAAEPIFVRQYGPGDPLTGTLFRSASLLDANGNTSFPGTIVASNLSGTNTGDQTNISGNAATANAAAGVSFLTQPNATWAGRIQLGGNGDPGAVAGTAVVQATDGNLHMDSGTGKSIYLNYYRNGIIYLNGGTYYISSNGSQYNGNAATATTAGRAYPLRVGGVDLNFNWSGQSGQPPWLWGGSDGSNMYVYNPSNFSVNYAATAGSAPAAGGTATALNSSNYINRCGSSGNANTDFQNTPAGSVRHNGDDAGLAGGPGNSWWFYDNYRHSNASNYWGIQVAWGWEDNANRLATRNVSANSFGGWVYYLNSSNYTSYIDAPNKAGTSYYQANTWIQLNGEYGLYAPSINNAHWYPNASGSYGAWAMTGSKGSWQGIDFTSGQDRVQLMVHTNSNDTGFHNIRVGWQFRWSGGQMYIYKNAYGGGTEAIALDSSNWSSYVNGSDERKKENIRPLVGALDKIKQLNGVTYSWIKDISGKREIGLLAQKVQNIVPEVVHYDEHEDMFSVKYGNLSALLIEGVKEQDNKINELTNMVSLLQETIKTLLNK